MEGQTCTDMMKLTVAFHNYGNTPRKAAKQAQRGGRGITLHNLTSALGGGGLVNAMPTPFYPQWKLYRMLSGQQGLSVLIQEIEIVQPIVSHYPNYTITAPLFANSTWCSQAFTQGLAIVVIRWELVLSTWHGCPNRLNGTWNFHVWILAYHFLFTPLSVLQYVNILVLQFMFLSVYRPYLIHSPKC
jgi:hypothetical protein